MGRTVTRTLLRKLHRWIGLALALPLIVQALTGLIMVADPFAASLANIPSANGPLVEPEDLRNVDATDVLNAARTAVPADLKPVRWRVQPDATVAVDFAALGHGQPQMQVGLDAFDAKVLWVRRNPDSVYRWVHAVHETFLFGASGRIFVGCIGAALLFMGLSGIPIWWPPRNRWKAAFGISRNATGWQFQRQLHGAAGIWIAALLLVQSLSGIAMAFPQTARALVGIPVQDVRRPRTAAAEAPPDPIPLIAAGIASAQAAMPRAVLLDLRLPPVPGRPMIARLIARDRWAGSPDIIVSMDPVTARILSVQDPAAAAIGASILNWLRSWHEGGAAGPAGRLLMCVFAIVLPLLPITGIAMWIIGWAKRRQPAARKTGQSRGIVDANS
jgi:uncharacterized iron-regulated membrane protein